jgi:hypothetical protein
MIVKRSESSWHAGPALPRFWLWLGEPVACSRSRDTALNDFGLDLFQSEVESYGFPVDNVFVELGLGKNYTAWETRRSQSGVECGTEQSRLFLCQPACSRYVLQGRKYEPL